MNENKEPTTPPAISDGAEKDLKTQALDWWKSQGDKISAFHPHGCGLAYIAGFKAAALPRDEKIRDLELQLEAKTGRAMSLETLHDNTCKAYRELEACNTSLSQTVLNLATVEQSLIGKLRDANGKVEQLTRTFDKIGFYLAGEKSLTETQIAAISNTLQQAVLSVKKETEAASPDPIKTQLVQLAEVAQCVLDESAPWVNRSASLLRVELERTKELLK
jgi:hypothetical protein